MTSWQYVSIGVVLWALWGSPRPVAWAHQEVSDERPAALREVGLAQRLNAQVPLALTFCDEAGNVVQLGDYFGTTPVILVLSYYECPRLCPLVLDGLLKSLRVLAFDVGTHFQVVTVSIDPRDTADRAAAKKAQYLQRYGRPGAAAGWHFLTGEAAAIQQLAQAIGFQYAYDTETQQYAHASGIMLATPQGRLARYFYGLEYAPRDIRLGLVEASANRIASPVEQLLLFCYRYDPVTGRYTVAITNIVRLAGLSTVLVVGLGLGVMWRREKRREG